MTIFWILLVAVGAVLFGGAVVANFIGEATTAYKKMQKKA